MIPRDITGHVCSYMLTVTPNARCQKDDGRWKPSLKGRFDFLYSDEVPCEQWFLQAGRCFSRVASGLEKPLLAGY